jgi:hypothetical protein
MSDRPAATSVALVCNPQSERAPQVEQYLRTHDLGAVTRYAFRDVDHLEQAVRAGTVQRIVFPETADFLGLLWDDLLTPGTWQAPGLCIEFARAEDALTPAQIADVLTAWEAWHRARRRRRAIAGLILSVLAIAAAWILLALAR